LLKILSENNEIDDLSYILSTLAMKKIGIDGEILVFSLKTIDCLPSRETVLPFSFIIPP
jgi:hypothetical protein